VTTTPEYSELALQGVSDIAAGFPAGGYTYSPQVKAAVEAGLAYDSDPTSWASDMNIGKSAALTILGLRVAREQGYLQRCQCFGCEREANPVALVTHADHPELVYCRQCALRGNREGWIYSDVPVAPDRQCYDHYLLTHAQAAAERRGRLDANTRTSTRRRRDYEQERRWTEATSYIDPAHQRRREFY